MFHNRVTLNDSTAARRQPAVPADGRGLRTAASTTRRRRRPAAPTAVRHAGAWISSSSTRPSYMWSAGVQREMPFGFVVDVDLRRPPRPLPAARAQHQPAAARARSRPTRASTSRRCGRTRATASSACRENAGRSMYNSLQLSADRRYSNGLKVGVAYTLGKSEDNASDKRDVLWNTYDDTELLGAVELRSPARAVDSTTSTTCRSGATPTNWSRTLLGGWQISGATFMRTRHAVLDHPQQRHRGRGRRQRIGQPVERRTAIRWRAPTGSSRAGVAPTTTSGSIRRRSRSPAARHVRQRDRATTSTNPGDQQWDIALFKNFTLGGHAQDAVPRGDLQLHRTTRT